MQLSICIATYNRGRFIGETLDSVVSQLRPGVEIVVVDGASPDDTQTVVSDYVARFPAIRYFRESKNSGVDGDYDKAVEYALGDHCWLFPDDDLLAPSAIDRALEALEGGAVDLLVVDAEIRDVSLTRTLQPRRLKLKGERSYWPEDANALLRDAGYALSFIGSTIIRRSLWMSRSRKPYFGSLFVHVGVIFQAPALGHAKVLPEALVSIRAGNAMWRPRSFEIWAFKWPSLIWGFDGYTDEARQAVTPREPWRNFCWLLGYRAFGAYSKSEYDQYFSGMKLGLQGLVLRLIAALPGQLANLLGVGGLALLGKGGGPVVYELVTCSRYSNWASRLLAGLCRGRLNSSAIAA